jgi:DMSO reductase family type II enzyme heme b subunit
MKKPINVLLPVVTAYFLCVANPANAVRPAQHDFTYEPEFQATTIDVGATDEDLSHFIDPQCHKWSAVPGQTVQLFAQKFMNPEGGGSTSSAVVKAVRGQDGIVFNITWSDSTRDDAFSLSQFKDMAAIEFPLASSEGSSLAMGHERNPVNIILWQSGIHGSGLKAKKLKTRKERQQFLNSQFTEMVAEGTFNRRPKEQRFQLLQGQATWRRWQWQVTFFKPFNTADSQNPNFGAEDLPVAFAVWNGSAGEHGSQKSVSAWSRLKFRK